MTTATTTADSAAKRLGRRLPTDAYFTTVEELFALPPDEREDVVVLLSTTGGPWQARSWMSIESLLRWSDRASSLVQAPLGLVVIASRR